MLVIPEANVSKLIGHRGSNIKMLQKTSGAFIEVVKIEFGHKVLVRGAPDKVDAAKAMLSGYCIDGGGDRQQQQHQQQQNQQQHQQQQDQQQHQQQQDQQQQQRPHYTRQQQLDLQRQIASARVDDHLAMLLAQVQFQRNNLTAGDTVIRPPGLATRSEILDQMTDQERFKFPMLSTQQQHESGMPWSKKHR